MPTVQNLARDLYFALLPQTRNNGETYYTLAEGSPDWMSDAIQSAHGDFMPEDWRYQAIKEVCSAMMDSDDPADAHQEIDSLVDVYTGRLTAWLASNLNRVAYCNEAIEEYGSTFSSVSDLLMLGQYREYEEIWNLLVSEFEKLSDDEDDESSDDSDSEGEV